MSLLFGGIPGGPELIILFVVFLFMLGIPLAFGVGLFLLGRWSADGDDEEIQLLRDRINTLEEEVTARESVAGDEPTAADDAADGEESTTTDDRER
jgi:sec-independent protein translocase protein TatA